VSSPSLLEPVIGRPSALSLYPSTLSIPQMGEPPLLFEPLAVVGIARPSALSLSIPLYPSLLSKMGELPLLKLLSLYYSLYPSTPLYIPLLSKMGEPLLKPLSVVNRPTLCSLSIPLLSKMGEPHLKPLSVV
jgi:hypothetical protein